MLQRHLIATAIASLVCLGAFGQATASAKISLGFVAGPHASSSSLDAISASGAAHVREKFSWAESEPKRGVMHWTALDADVAAASRAHLPLLAVLADTPAWAIEAKTPRGQQDTYPTRIANFTAWAGRLAARYGPSGSFWSAHPELTPLPVRRWQIWNEPNVASIWTGGVASPERYAALLTQSRDAIRNTDLWATVEAAGMASSGSAGASPDSFLKSVWRVLGPARSAVYRWDIHAYSDTAAHAAALVPYMRHLMDSNGCKACGITVGEFGWASGAAIGQRYGWLCAGSASRQADMAHYFLATVLRSAATNRLVELSWYRWDDPDPRFGATGCFRSLGVVNYLGVPKPALATFERFTK